ncbi:S-layer homology domain-containing protein [Gorillibacterium sp. sgz5001074]|uniref:S-layer homology domain-containing protein n=1 Tax=Gorillibacterium sp. sgz5001074 TaxID=3446695 RepID=UPI003F67AA0D
MLKKKGTRITSLLLVLALFLSLLPPLSYTAHADGARIDINNLKVSLSRPTGTEDNQIQRLTTNPIELKAYITNITDALVQNIYYEIENINTGSVVTEKMNKALQSGNMITFKNVYLSEGLNKITLKLGETSVISSVPGWAYFTPVTNITSLKVNTDYLEEGGMYPKNMTANSANTALTISGTAANATDVQAEVLGYSSPISNYFMSGTFTFSVEDVAKKNDSLANIFLNAGDNRITFVAKNNSNSYQLVRNFIYDNGKPFAFKANIAPTATPAAKEQLMTQPVMTVNNVTLTGKLKVPITVTSGVYGMEYPYVKIIAGDQTFPTANTYNLTNNVTDTGVSITKNLTESGSDFNIFDYSIDTTLNNATKSKYLQFSFFDTSTPTISTFSISSRYNFSYVDPSLPYVHSVNIAQTDQYAGTNKDPGIRMSETSANDVNEMPKKLRIFAGSNTATAMNVYIDGAKQTGTYTGATASTPTLNARVTDAAELNLLNDPTAFLFLYELNGLPNGTHTLRFVPLTGGVENTSGVLSVDIKVSSAPYIIMDNIYNGMILKDRARTIKCSSGGDNCLSGRLVNVPEADQLSTVVSINDGAPMQFKDTAEIKDILDSKVGRFKFIYKGIGTGTDKRDVSLQEGRNTFKFYIYVGGQLVNTVTYEVFVYSSDSPDFVGTVLPIPKNATERTVFIPAKNVDTYSTNEAEVIFTGKFTGATSLKITARSKNADGTPIFNSSLIEFPSGSGTVTNTSGDGSNTIGVPPYLDGSSLTVTADTSSQTYSGTFKSLGIKLNPKGDTIFELEITNSSNIKVIKTITIQREPLPYKVTKPTLIKNDKGEDQATINSNFQTVVVEAEFADKVLFGKDEALKLDTPGKYLFQYEVTDLKAGKNNVKFTVVRGSQKTNGSFVLYNSDTAVEGASYKTKMNTSMKVFDGMVNLKFPKDTSLMRNEESNQNQYLTTERDLLFGIANQTDGRIDKTYALSDPVATNYLREPTLRFKPAGKLFWIDTGTIAANAADLGITELEKALQGSGRYPYSDSDKFYYRNIKDQVVPTQRGTLTLKYDPSVRDNAWKYLTVYHFGFYENKNGVTVPMWKNIGGVVDPGSNSITVPFETSGYYQVMYMAKSYQDVTNHPWAREDLDTLYSKGIMVNKTTTSFMPNDFITRGEFVTLLVKIFDIPLNYSGGLTFEDVGLYKMEELSDYKAIETAARAGIVRGLTETQFMPNLSLTRQDAAVMIARAADMKLGNDKDKSLVTLQKSFTDANGIDLYARTSVEAVTKAGLITGKENVLLQGQSKATFRFDPLESFTRAEAAAVAIRVLKQQKKIPK